MTHPRTQRRAWPAELEPAPDPGVLARLSPAIVMAAAVGSVIYIGWRLAFQQAPQESAEEAALRMHRKAVAAKRFAPIVAAAAKHVESKSGTPLPEEVLRGLLEDPGKVLSGSLAQAPVKYKHVGLSWHSLGAVADPSGAEAEHAIAHSASQPLAWTLRSGRSWRYRVHRFALPGVLGWPALVAEAAGRERSGEGLLKSNVGGYHSGDDFFSASASAAAKALRRHIAVCICRALASDIDVFGGDSGPHLASPCEADGLLGRDQDCWVNVSRRGDLNMMHVHRGHAFSAVFYARAPQNCGGQLLLRLSPWPGWEAWWPSSETLAAGDQSGATKAGGLLDRAGPGPVLFSELAPRDGTLVIFPAWLPHSVAPHFSQEERISVASNWAVP